MKSDSKSPAIAAAIAGLITFLLYLPALRNGFVNLDDPLFVQNNPYIRELNGELIAWAFSSRALDLFIPLTWISFALDYRFWGLNPLGFHLTNILLHAAATILVGLVAARLPAASSATGGAGSARESRPNRHCLVPLLAALLFGMHPLRVESVAWITERKDVLSGLFTLASVYFYLRHAGKTSQGGRRDYLLSLALFACSLLAKPVSVGLPLLLLLLDWYPLQRLRHAGLYQSFREKIPFFALSLASGLLTIYLFSQKQLLVGLASLPFPDRILLSGNALFEYCRLLLLPLGILPFYELPDTLGAGYLLKSMAVLVFTCICLLQLRRRPWLPAAWFSFLLPVLPVLSFLQNNDVALAARYTYLPSVAPSILAAFAAVAVLERLSRKQVRLAQSLLLGLVLLLLCYGAITCRLIGVWHDTASLWTRVIELNPATSKYMDRGVYHILQGEPAAAVADFSSAIGWLARRGKSPDHNAYAFRGVAEMDLQRYEGALLDFDAALALKPHPTYYYYRGLALRGLGRGEEAETAFRLAGPNPPPIDTF